MEAVPENSEGYADISELYIRECVAAGESTTRDHSGHEEETEQEGQERAEGAAPGEDRGGSKNEEQDRGMTRAELDRRRAVVLDTYTRFYEQLWPDKQPEKLHDLSYYSPMATEVQDRGQEFRDAVYKFGREFGRETISEEICVFYDTIELSGAYLKKGRKQGNPEGVEMKEKTMLNLWELNPEIKLQVSGSETITVRWHDATLGYMNQYYPDDGVYRIPATLEVEDNIKYILKASDGASKPNVSPASTRGAVGDAITKPTEVHEEQHGDDNLQLSQNDGGRKVIQGEVCFPKDKKKSKAGAKGKTKGKKVELGDLSLRTEQERNELLSTKFQGLPSEEKKKEEQYHTREKARIAEEEMLSSFEQWGKRHGLNMFIIGGYSFDSFLKNVIGQPLYISKLYKGEFDILILCQEFGLILIEVKSSVAEASREPETGVAATERTIPYGGQSRGTASTSTIAKDLAYAWGQLMNRNFVVREMNRDLGFVKKIPVKAFIGVPFLTTDDLEKVKICPSHKKYVICGDQLSNLDGWLLNHFPMLQEERTGTCLSRIHFRELVSRFVGRVSAVTTDTDTIRYTSRKMTCAFMTPQQRSLLETGRKHTVVFGDYGTGKTLLMIKKALALVAPRKGGAASEGTKVHYVPCCDVSNFEACYGVTFSHQAEFVRKFVAKLDEKQSKCITCYDSFLDFFKVVTGSNTQVFNVGRVEEAIRSATKSENNLKHHFLFDEFPVQSLQEGGLKKIYESVQHSGDSGGGSISNDIEGRESQSGCLWVSIATHSLGVSSSDDPSQALVDKLGVVPNGVGYVYLNKVMRVSKPVYAMIRLIEGYIDKGHGMLSNLGHMVQGMKPQLYRLPPRECGDGGTLLGCECGCARKRMSVTLRRIIDSLEVQEGKNTIEITIMLYYVISSMMFNRIHSLIEAARIELTENPDWDKSITLEWNTMQYHAKNRAGSIFLDGLSASPDSVEGAGAKVGLPTQARVSNVTESGGGQQLFAEYEERVMPFEELERLVPERFKSDRLSLATSTVQSETNKTDMDGESTRHANDQMSSSTHFDGPERASNDSPRSGVESDASRRRSQTDDLDNVSFDDELHTDIDDAERWKGSTPSCKKKKVTINVVDQRTFAGCEAPALIFIDPFEMRHWFKRGSGTGSGYHSLIFTRCTGHFILVTWPKEEAHTMWERHLDEYGEEIERSNASEKYKLGRRHYIESGRAAHSKTSDTCLDLLLDKNAIEEKSLQASFGEDEE